MKICGKDVPGIHWEELFNQEKGRKSIKFIDGYTGFFNYFPLPDDAGGHFETSLLIQTLALTFLSQCSAFRASLHTIALSDLKDNGPLGHILEDDKK